MYLGKLRSTLGFDRVCERNKAASTIVDVSDCYTCTDVTTTQSTVEDVH